MNGNEEDKIERIDWEGYFQKRYDKSENGIWGIDTENDLKHAKAEMKENLLFFMEHQCNEDLKKVLMDPLEEIDDLISDINTLLNGYFKNQTGDYKELTDKFISGMLLGIAFGTENYYNEMIPEQIYDKLYKTVLSTDKTDFIV